MKLLNTARALPLSTRRALVTIIVAIFAVAGVSIWIAFDFGVPKDQGGLGAISEGADSVAQLVQQQTDRYEQTKQELEANLEQTLKSSALVLPDSLANNEEEPDGVLFLNYQHRAQGIATNLIDVSFFPSYSVVRTEITNEGDHDVYLDAGHGSVIEQYTGLSTVAVQPIFQTGSPSTIAPQDKIEVQLVFSPLNGRQPFAVAIGDFADTKDTNQTWSATFEIDPSSIVSEQPEEAL